MYFFCFLEENKKVCWNYISRGHERKDNMNDSISLLQKQFLKIKKMGYVKSVRRGNTGIGATFENLLGKSEKNFEIPDYYGIEIKTKRSYSKCDITLFNAVPTGSSYYEVKRLRDTYGYSSREDRNLKKLNATINSCEQVKVGLWYYFSLKVDRENQKLRLYVYNRNGEVIDNSTYWDFDILKEKLERKLQLLALIKAWPNRINGFEYFKYYKMNIYVLREFNCFVDALEEGKIKLCLTISSYSDEKRYGMVRSHGIAFRISEDDLLSIFEIYR